MASRAATLLFLVAAVALVALPVLGFDPREFARRHGGTTRLSIATGNTGGVYYPYGGGLARIISHSLPRVDATAEVTAASVDNLKLIQQGKADIAFTFGDTLDDAVRGRGAFARSPVRARTLANLYPSYTQIATLESTHIDRLTDLRGKVVSTGSPGSGTEVMALRLLKAAGLDGERDLRRQGLSVNASVDALKDGKIDAFFWTGGIPTASLLDLTSTMGIRPKLLPNDDLLPALQAAYGPSLYFRLVVPGRNLSGPDVGHRRRGRRQPARGGRTHERGPRLRPDASAVREATGSGRRPPGGGQAHARDRHRGIAGAIPSRRDPVLP